MRVRADVVAVADVFNLALADVADGAKAPVAVSLGDAKPKGKAL